MKIGDSIKYIRKKKQISQNQLATSINISQTYLSLIENNEKKPSLKILEKIENFLHIPLSIILFLSIEEDEVPNHKKEYFNLLQPSILKFINEIFFENNL